MTIIIPKLKLFNFFPFMQRIMECKYFSLPRGRVWILRKRTNILLVNDSTSKGNEPSKFTVRKKKGNQTRKEKLPVRKVQIERNRSAPPTPYSWQKGSWKEVKMKWKRVTKGALGNLEPKQRACNLGRNQ